jgi:HAD superfamily hydrolase (TIGR01509 family)
MIHRVVFDLGGVVFNWQPLVLLREVLPQRVQSDDDARHWAAQIFQSLHPDSDWAQFDLGRVSAQQLAARIATRAGLEMAEVLTVINAIPPHLQPMDETVELIDTLHSKGVPLYYLSNMPAPYAEQLVQANPFFDRFRDGIFSAHVNQIKPERPIFQTADARFGAAGQGTLFIDDSLPNIEEARAHGWQTVHFTSPAQCRAELAAHGLV